MDYKESGVDIDKADAFVEDIKDIAESTFNKNVLKGIGLFGSFFQIPENWMPPYMYNPVLVSSTDGVGTKIKIACQMCNHKGIGQDLVAMCVNDILTCGAIPLFFLDYYAVGKLKKERDKVIIQSIADACKEAQCALVGGETAEMPGFYKGDAEYDISGFVVGIASKDFLIDGSNIKKGNVIIGISSSGVHSNGFSLIRKIFQGNQFRWKLNYMDKLLGDELLTPTYIYTKVVTEILEDCNVNGMAHITGGGIYGNIDRIIPDNLGYNIDITSLEIPKIFNLIQMNGNIDIAEMFKVFNMGIGYVLVADKECTKSILAIIENHGYQGCVMGEIVDKENA